MPPPKDPEKYKVFIEKQRQSHLGKTSPNKGKKLGKMSEEIKEKHRLSMLGKNKGRHSPYIIDKQRESHKGIPWSEKRKAKGQPPCKKETKEKLRIALLGKNKGKLPSIKTMYSKWCFYNSYYQGKIRLRSSYELAYTKYLDSLGKDWLYEPQTFDLGDTTYTPDFYLIHDDKFIEIKGYMRKDALEKIDLFLKEYNEKLDILFGKDLTSLGCKIG